MPDAAAILPASELAPGAPEKEALAEHFHDLRQQKAAHVMGLWVFLATELLFFGALFAAYLVYRLIHPGPFLAAARETEVAIGTLNTFLILTSGFSAALAVKAGQMKARRAVLWFVGITVALGILFLGAKGFEYYLDIQHHLWPGSREFELTQPPSRIFWSIYWLLTGLHAVHMSAGIVAWAVVWEMTRRRTFPLAAASRVHIVGLYWAFVDLMWLIIWPLLYLVGRT